VGHFRALNSDIPRIIYNETGKIYEEFDNNVFSLGWKVEVHFYTRTEFDPIVEQLENLFNKNNIGFRLLEIKYGWTEVKANADSNAVAQNELIYYLFECAVPE